MQSKCPTQLFQESVILYYTVVMFCNVVHVRLNSLPYYFFYYVYLFTMTSASCKNPAVLPFLLAQLSQEVSEIVQRWPEGVEKQPTL